jgi:hypothetical protein
MTGRGFSSLTVEDVLVWGLFVSACGLMVRFVWQFC